MLCGGAEKVPAGDWFYEVKWDGYRCIAVVEKGVVSLWSRSGLAYTVYPHIEDDLSTLPDCVIDGELAVLSKQEKGGDFAVMSSLGNDKATFIVFDVIESGGKDLRAEPFIMRRSELELLLEDDTNTRPSVQLSPVSDDGEAMLTYARENGLEGIVAKRPMSQYQEGSRSSWLKIKLRQEQEFVVLGWTEGKNGNTGHLGALILGVFEDDGHYRFCGKVGTGFDNAEADRLKALLEEGPQFESRVDGGYADQDTLIQGVPAGKEYREAHWAWPTIVVQVEFQRWTKDGVLWHPSYKGQRHDKLPSEVRRES
jgi:bifunctional non-homologous end joining protein LigD